MSEEPLERSRRTIENARDAADEAREAEPFHREADEETPRNGPAGGATTDQEAAASGEDEAP